MPTYDVFLSHNSTDKPAVETLAQQLVAAGLNPWLDKWNLIPGEPWQEDLEEALDVCQTVAVFLGPTGISPWENEEMRSALEVRAHDKSRRVIPVLLPGAPDPRDRPLPRFLRRLTWVDFRSGLDDDNTFQRLVAGIRGIAPGGNAIQAPSPSTSSVEPGQISGQVNVAKAEVTASLRRQLAQLYSNLNKLREQAAIFGAGETPLHLLNKIEAEEIKIEQLEKQLQRPDMGREGATAGKF